jgi:hypothetical protein
MSKETEAAERAEFIQSLNALLIPLCSFLACVIMAAGAFLIYQGESIGWAFVAVSVTTVIAATVALIKFQNKLRARGVIRSEMHAGDAEKELLVFDPEELGVGVVPPASQPSYSAATVQNAKETVVLPEPLALR